jgi:hypothetical protein
LLLESPLIPRTLTTWAPLHIILVTMKGHFFTWDQFRLCLGSVCGSGCDCPSLWWSPSSSLALAVLSGLTFCFLYLLLRSFSLRNLGKKL